MNKFGAQRVTAKIRTTRDACPVEAGETAPMPVFADHSQIAGRWHGGVYAIGNFDGLHIGHQALIRQTVNIAAAAGVHPAVLTFDPHPRELLDPSAPPFRLATAARKTHDLNRLGTGLCLNQRFDRDFAALTPPDFVDFVLLRSLRASHVVVGADFRFGSRQAGNTGVLQELCARHGIGSTVVDQVRLDGEVASSSLARRRAAAGRMAEVAETLGRPWSVTATPEAVGGRLRFDLSDYTPIAAGAYDVRIDGTACRATLERTGDSRQALLVQDTPGLPADGPAVIAFVCPDKYGDG